MKSPTQTTASTTPRPILSHRRRSMSTTVSASGSAARVASLRRVTTALADLPLLASGKVRDMYDLGDRLLMVASDRISTYDVVHPTPIPDKGKVLTGLSVFWFEQTGEHRAQPPRLDHRRRARRGARAGACA